MDKEMTSTKRKEVEDLLEDLLNRHFAGTISITEKLKFTEGVSKIYKENE